MTQTIPRASAGATAADLLSPPAARISKPRWSDPRLILGALLVLGSIVVGSAVVASADRTVSVWAVRGDAALAPGQQVEPDDVRAASIGPGGIDLDRYLTVETGEPFPAGYVSTRAVGAGELLPKAALGRPDAGVLRYVTLAVPTQELPSGLTRGDVVDVWAAPAAQPGGGDAPAAVRLLASVTVERAESGGGALGVTGDAVPVTLAVRAPGTTGASATADGTTGASATADGTTATSTAELDDAVARLLAAARSGQIYLTLAPAVAR